MSSRTLKFTILLLAMLLLMACSLIGASPTPIATLVFSTRTPQAQTNAEVPAATPTQIPSDTPLPPTDLPTTPTLVPPPILPTRPANPTLQFDSALNAYRVEFGAGGTWAQFNGTLDDSGQSVRYVLSAMQGQIMSISIAESWPFYVDVENGGNIIGNADTDHPFWRGTLPSSGNYFITVKTRMPDMPDDYTLRIAINPPGQAHQTFTTQQSLFTLKYSDEFSPTTYIPVGEFKGTPRMVLNFINSDFYGPVTNLGEAYLMANIISDTGTCLQIYNPEEAFLGEKTFNGKTFAESRFEGAAAGNIYEQFFYRAVLNNTCYEIVFFMHSSNIGNYTPGTVVEFDRLALLQKFEEVLATFEVN